jgi:hypothetical protein
VPQEEMIDAEEAPIDGLALVDGDRVFVQSLLHAWRRGQAGRQ